MPLVCNLTLQLDFFLNEDNSLEENVKLKEELESDERNAHENVKLLLRKYERCRVVNISHLFLLFNELDARAQCTHALFVHFSGNPRLPSCCRVDLPSSSALYL